MKQDFERLREQEAIHVHEALSVMESCVNPGEKTFTILYYNEKTKTYAAGQKGLIERIRMWWHGFRLLSKMECYQKIAEVSKKALEYNKRFEKREGRGMLLILDTLLTCFSDKFNNSLDKQKKKTEKLVLFKEMLCIRAELMKINSQPSKFTVLRGIAVYTSAVAGWVIQQKPDGTYEESYRLR